MKSKLLLLILTCSVVLFGCKKEKSPEDKLVDAKKQIIGTWQVQSGNTVYYDASGKVVKTDPADISDDVKIQFIDGTTVKSSDSNDPYQYTLSNVDGKIMLNVTGASYEVKVNSNTMSWIIEQNGDDGNGIVKGITTINFKKI